MEIKAGVSDDLIERFFVRGDGSTEWHDFRLSILEYEVVPWWRRKERAKRRRTVIEKYALWLNVLRNHNS